MIRILVAISIALIAKPSLSQAQHCPPIADSYLSALSISRTKQKISFTANYMKTGGQAKDSYQVYVLAYSDSNAEEIMSSSAQTAIENSNVTVLEKQLAKRNDEGKFELAWELDSQAFVKMMVDDDRISNKRLTNNGGWERFNDDIRLALFIPFLDDKEYSNIDGLPEDRHECNYMNESALLFEQLPHRLSVHFGIVQGYKLNKGHYHIHINGNRPKRKPPPQNAR